MLVAAAGCFDFAAYDHIVCQPGFHQCDDACVSSDDVASCGISCTPCPAPLDGNGRAVCDGTQCGIADCTDGYHVCGNTCVKNDINACGEICAVCPHSLVPHEQALCDGTSCSFACETGHHLCGAACLADDSFDSCGGACEPCALTLPSNARGTCKGGQCGYECLQSPVTFSAAQQVTATIAPADIALADFDGDGWKDLVSTDILGSYALVQRNLGNGTFGDTVSLATASMALGSALIGVGDFSGDGKIDVAIVKDGFARVYLNQTVASQLAFSDGVPYAFNGSLTVADFDGDGKIDLGNGTQVLFGLGDGTFSAAVAHVPSFGVSRDLNLDGLPDLVYRSGDNATVLLRNQLGGYLAAVDYPVGADMGLLDAGDVNGDGVVDLIATRPGVITVLLGIGGGTFAAAVDVLVAYSGYSAVGDYNGDGKIDLLGINATLFNTSTTTTLSFGPRIEYLLEQGARFAVGDIDNDQRDDLVSAFMFTGTIGIARGTSKPSLSATLLAAPMGRLLVAGDFNSDGKRDFATAFAIYLGDGLGTIDSGLPLDQPSANAAMVARDINGDGHLDLIRLNTNGYLDPTPGEVAISLGLGDGTVMQSLVFSAGVNPWALGVADVDADGKLDIVVGSLFATSVSFLRGHGDGTFDAPIDTNAGTGTTSLSIGDYDGDGHLDVAVQGTGNLVDGPLRMAVIRGRGDGTFEEPTVQTFGKGSQTVFWRSTELASGDLNRDGKDDLVSASRDGGVYVFLGGSNPLLGAPIKYPAADGAISIVLTDFNGDGALDIAAASATTAKTSVLAGNSDGTFAITRDFPTRNAYGLIASDIDGDGSPDLATIGDSGMSFVLNAQTARCTPWAEPW